MEYLITVQPISAPIKIDLNKVIEHGDTPTAIILSLAVFSAVLLERSRS